FGVEEDDITGPSRAREHVMPRHMYCHVLKERWPDMSYSRIGVLVGRQDHSTILQALRSFRARIERDERLQVLVKGLIAIGRVTEPKDAHIRAWRSFIAKHWLSMMDIDFEPETEPLAPLPLRSADHAWRSAVIDQAQLSGQVGDKLWCEQCQSAVSPAAGSRCSDRFCSLKVTSSQAIEALR
ncbi:MAG: helix-turn-helix domain-containing protein, partial [Pseudomonadota bacterium]